MMIVQQLSRWLIGGCGIVLGLSLCLSARPAITTANATELRAATGGEPCKKCGDLDYDTCSMANNNCSAPNVWVAYTDLAIYNPFNDPTGTAIDADKDDVCWEEFTCTDCVAVGGCSGGEAFSRHHEAGQCSTTQENCD